MNKVILMGRLTRDPETRYTQTNNTLVSSFSLAVNRRFVRQGEERQADFVNIVAWSKLGEFCSKYFKKGQQVGIIGRIQTRNYTAQDGTKRYVTEVLVDNLTFLGSRSDNGGNAYSDNFGGNSYPATGGYDNNYSTPTDVASMPTTDISEDPFKDFGEEITLSDDDLPF